jgi:hypothetical protein
LSEGTYSSPSSEIFLILAIKSPYIFAR